MKHFLIAALLVVSTPVGAQLTIDQLISEAGLREGGEPVREHPGWRKPEKIVAPASIADLLRAAYPDIEIVSASRSDAASKVAGADVLLSWCSNDIVSSSERLRWVQIFSAGAERCLSTDKILDGSVLLTNAQKMTSPAIGEHAIAMTLSLSRSLVQYAKSMPDAPWERANTIETVDGKTMLVAGLGGIGRETAKRANALGMRVIGTRNSSREGPDYVDYVGLSDELLELAGQADVVVNALPLTDKTRGLFNADFFDAVKPGVIFVNVARGGSVVQDDLIAALNDGRVAAAGLDVTDPEPLPADHPLWQMDNVLITPHIAWAGADRQRTALLAIENVRRYIAGERLLNVVDPARGY
ncbi:MAG: D-2-hydroxyacid dehydrogenase [Pseudomonadota bacterium]